MSKVIYEPAHTTHWKNLFPNKMLLLGSQNMNTGEELIATITAVKVDTIKDQNGKQESVPILTFENAPPMVLNITNAKTISALYGEHYDGWIGKSVQIFATAVEAFGETANALRIREIIPNADIDTAPHVAALECCKTMEALAAAFTGIPKHIRPLLIDVKNEMKAKLTP